MDERMATDSRHIECKAAFAGNLPVRRLFAVLVLREINPSPFTVKKKPPSLT
jgi:hypothetical protein